jgi:aminoglycoside phosphotransferase (APT) family kinase protein
LQSPDLERLREIVPGTGALDIQSLPAWLCHETFRVMREGRAFSLRLSGAQPHDLGLDRHWQARLQTEAADRGFAPRVVYSDPLQGMLLAEWVDGRSWSPEEASSAANIGKVAALAHRIEALNATHASVMGPGHWIELYTEAIAARPPAQPSDGRRGGVEPAARARASKRPDEELHAAAAVALEHLARLPPARPAVCHSDLHTMNLIERGESLIVLDWEYAHVGEPLWDLAGWSANNDFPFERRQELLPAYLGAVPAAGRERFELLCWLYDYVCLLWSELYLGEGTDRATLLDARLRLTAH